ncbi:MAG: LeuD/DmdB family oxidoreductase small subunit [Thermoplasmata archaeon]
MMAIGKVWKFGDDVNTDMIIPGRYLDDYDPAHLAAHAMEGASREFAKAVSRGDIVVAGSNFGCGSSREQAVMALKESGVAAVVAKSFARIFYRNSVNLGLVVLVSQDAFDSFQDGEMAILNLDSSSLVSRDGSRKAHVEEIPPHVKVILDHGGLVPYLKQKLAGKNR